MPYYESVGRGFKSLRARQFIKGLREGWQFAWPHLPMEESREGWGIAS